MSSIHLSISTELQLLDRGLYLNQLQRQAFETCLYKSQVIPNVPSMKSTLYDDSYMIFESNAACCQLSLSVNHMTSCVLWFHGKKGCHRGQSALCNVCACVCVHACVCVCVCAGTHQKVQLLIGGNKWDGWFLWCKLHADWTGQWLSLLLL